MECKTGVNSTQLHFHLLHPVFCKQNPFLSLIDEARVQILRCGGVEKIIKKLSELHNLDGSTDADNRLHITVCGSVLNVSLDNGKKW